MIASSSRGSRIGISRGSRPGRSRSGARSTAGLHENPGRGSLRLRGGRAAPMTVTRVMEWTGSLDIARMVARRPVRLPAAAARGLSEFRHLRRWGLGPR